MIAGRGTTYLSRITMAFIITGTALAVVPPTAHADQDSDFLGCLSNHGVTWKDRDVTLALAKQIKQQMPEFVSPDAQVFYLSRHGLPQDVAKIDVECVQAATLMNGH